eukprot:m.1387992 g.1387992  ORF g.1387992 m.1387992 type:complete len:532 (-) comp24986_c1_seq5:398-1993(-)
MAHGKDLLEELVDACWHKDWCTARKMAYHLMLQPQEETYAAEREALNHLRKTKVIEIPGSSRARVRFRQREISDNVLAHIFVHAPEDVVRAVLNIPGIAVHAINTSFFFINTVKGLAGRERVASMMVVAAAKMHGMEPRVHPTSNTNVPQHPQLSTSCTSNTWERWNAEGRSCSIDAEALSVLSFNARMSDHANGKDVFDDVLRNVKASRADVLALQDMNSAAQDLLLSDAHIQATYIVSVFQGSSKSFTVICVKKKSIGNGLVGMEMFPFKTRSKARRYNECQLVVATVLLNGRQTKFAAVQSEATKHTESRTVRARQLKMIQHFLAGAPNTGAQAFDSSLTGSARCTRDEHDDDVKCQGFATGAPCTVTWSNSEVSDNPRRTRLLNAGIGDSPDDCNTCVDVILMGNYNFSGNDEHATIFNGGFTDVWTALHAATAHRKTFAECAKLTGWKRVSSNEKQNPAMIQPSNNVTIQSPCWLPVRIARYATRSTLSGGRHRVPAKCCQLAHMSIHTSSAAVNISPSERSPCAV